MENIRIFQKDESISYEEIQNLLHRAHQSNIEKGLIYATANQSIEILKNKIGDDGVCYVATFEDKLVGTATVSFRTLNYWYHNGEVAIIKLVGVDPKYKGMHISSKLIEKCEECAKINNKTIIVSDSAEQNVIIKNLFHKHGFLTVDYGIYAANNFYTNVYAKWLNGCPYNKIYRCVRYFFKKISIRVKYKPGKVKRFKLF